MSKAKKKTEILDERPATNIEKNEDDFLKFVTNYWEYYLRLEEEFLTTRRYVEFSKDNYKSYSIEYLKLFQAACSEIDVVGKFLAHICNKKFKETDKSSNIQKWWFEIQNSFADDSKQLCDQTVDFLKIQSLQPWKNYHIVHVQYFKDDNKKLRQGYKLSDSPKSETPRWWSAYNAVKHNRTTIVRGTRTNYSKANLWDTANAFAALFLLEHDYLKAVGDQNLRRRLAKSKLFERESIFDPKVEGDTLSFGFVDRID